MAHFLISAAHKSSGKTTLAIGLCAELQRRGLRVAPFKKGPDYIDSLWLAQAAGSPCYNLDFYTTPRPEIETLFQAHLQWADIGVIEGNKGLYDGLDLDGSNSNAALAALLGAPVILVIDAQGMTRGIAPLILGYQAFDSSIHIAGVILNKVGGSRHEAKLRAVIEHYTDVPVIGAVSRAPELHIRERHLGLIPSNESGSSAERIEAIREAVADQVAVDALRRIAETARPVSPGETTAGQARSLSPDLRVGIARDEAFGFYYAGDLEALEAGGAELVYFSPVCDSVLPQVDALFLGGGFPEVRMEQLEANGAMRRDLRDFIEQGHPVYAECGGLMYLARSLTWESTRSEMVGVLPADAVMYERPQGRGYVRLRETAAFPWPNGVGQQIVGHEFHYSRLENLAPNLTYAYKVERGEGIEGRHDGIVYKNLLASYCHMRAVGDNQWPRRFLSHVRRCRKALG
jgi:cobyrinic acid a,c-diamide synthase